MTKKKRKRKPPRPERTLYCSGPNWDGDGSKQSSECPFNDSMISNAERYKCGHCTERQTPASIHADANGIRHKVNSPTKTKETEIIAEEPIKPISNPKPRKTKRRKR